MIKNEMGNDISYKDIERTHRIVTQKKDQKARPLIVKFVQYNDRRKVFVNKKRLKGKNLAITESLTRRRLEALKDAKKRYGFQKVWTSDGKIIYKEDGDDKTKVYYD